MLRLITPCVLPSRDGPGRAAVRAVIAPFAHDPAAGGALPDLVRFPRAVLRRMLDELLPRRLRILAWILATQRPGDPFRLSANTVARALGGKPDDAASAIVGLSANGWLEMIEQPDETARRSGLYWLGSVFGEE